MIKKWPSSGESNNSAGHSPSHTINAAHGQSQNHSSATDQSQTSITPFFRYRVIASFIFLRCISLALCTPRKYNLHIGSPPNISPVQDLLKLLAKLLQNWANFTPLKENSSLNVHPLNSYSRQHQQRMEFFLEGVSTSPQGTHDTIHKLEGYCDVAEKFASIHRICCDNYEALRKRSISYPALKKLLFIVDEISEHSSYPHSNQPSSGNHHNPHNKPQQHHPSRHNNKKVCHFEIIQSCGECFIGNKRFQSLEHLVDYYMLVGCIVQNEFLVQTNAVFGGFSIRFFLI